MGKKRKIKEEIDEQSTSISQRIDLETPSKKFKKKQVEKMDNEFLESFNPEIDIEEGAEYNQDNSTGKNFFCNFGFF